MSLLNAILIIVLVVATPQEHSMVLTRILTKRYSSSISL